ncbi:MAG: FAD-dependent oxidoreductase, partial [Chloroflexota bacterium]
LGIAGEEGPGVQSAVEFLKRVNSGGPVRLGKRTAVVGGGNSAVDAGRVALRRGSSEVCLVYRRSWDEMPASRTNLAEARLEGVSFQLLAWPVEVVRKNGSVIGVRCVRTRLGEPDASGWAEPVPVAGSEFEIDCDGVIVAVGERVDGASLVELKDMCSGGGGAIIVNPQTLETGAAGVFAGGDVVSGPASVVEAIAMGRRAAASIDRFLGGSGDIEERLAPVEETVEATSLQGFPVGGRQVMPEMAAGERLTGLGEVELGLPEESAITEARRCLRCDLPIRVDTNRCLGCLTCAMYCSLRVSGVFNPLKAAVRVWRYGPGNHEYEMSVGFTRECVDCGLCARYCPYGAITREIDRAYLEVEKRPGPAWEEPVKL